jgi:hypothetical protein
LVNITTEITIHAPMAAVSAYAANPDHAPEWYINIQVAEWKTPKPLSVGSRIAFVAQFLGRKLSYTYEITAFIPHQKRVMKTAEGPFPMETTYTWTAVDDRTTKMTLQNQGHPTGFSKWLAPFMANMMRKANTKDLQKLKQILESREETSAQAK